MKYAALVLAAGLTLTMAAVPDELPQEVLLLSHIKLHTTEGLQHLSNVSCLETVRREFKPTRGKLRFLDTIRLEVLTDGHKELFASPGGRKFSEQHPITYAGTGVLSDGFFGSYLKSIVTGDNVSETYKGEEDKGGRRLARFDYRLPVMWSGQVIRLQIGSGTVGLHGSFWADPRTYDVVRLEVAADDFPPTLPLTEAVMNITYAQTDLGHGSVVLLPESGDFRIVQFSGETSYNQMDFTHCRTFNAHSTIDFQSSDTVKQTTRFAVASLDDTLLSLPGGLQIAVSLRSRISSDLAVGAIVDGVTVADVPKKGPTIIPAGSPVRGRIRRLEHYTDSGPYFVIALEFTEVEVQGIRHRFYADIVEIEHAPGVEQFLSTQTEVQGTNPFGERQVISSSGETVWAHNLPGVATFFLRGERLILPGGFRTVWRTRVP